MNSLLKKYKYLWENTGRYVLLKVDNDRIPSIIDTNNTSMVLIEEDVDVILTIHERMILAGAVLFYSWKEYHKKYPPISPEERLMKIKYPDKDDISSNQN